MRTDRPILVVGAGSAGERHIRNLWRLGYRDLIVYRQRNLPFRDIGEATVNILTAWSDACGQKPFAAIICTPTAQHLQQVVDCLNAGMHVLVEKPLSHTMFDEQSLMDLLEEKNRVLQLGYMLHYHPLLKEVKQYIAERKFGNIINIQTYWGEYLPDWHPWEDYRQSYAANKEAGGGAALTLSHDVDIVNWLMDALPVRYNAMPNFASPLEVNTDSAFDALLGYANGVTAHVHVNFCQRIAQRWYKVLFDEAVADIDYYNASLKISTGNHIEEKRLDSFDRNEMFIAELQDFFSRIEAGNYTGFSQQQVKNAHNITKICVHEQ